MKKLRAIEQVLNKTPSLRAVEDKAVAEETCRQLGEYFREERTEFQLPLEFVGKDFQKKVWQSIKEVGYGKTVSYKELAIRCGKDKAYRAVAGACGANPIAVIVGCHRILASNGKIGGYTGGINKKIELLRHENQKIFA